MLVPLSFIFVAYQMVIRIFFGVILPDVMEMFDLSLSYIGIAAGVYYFSFAFSSIVTSLLYMRYNFIIIMLIGMGTILLGLLCFLFPCLGKFGVILGRFLIGVGSGMSLPLYLKVFSIFYDVNTTKTMVNYVFLNCMTTLSLSLYFVKPQYNVLYNYFTLFYVFIAIGVILTIGFLKSYYDLNVKKCETLSKKLDENKAYNVTLRDIKNFVCDRKVIFLGLVCGLLAGTPDAFSDLWSLMFFENCCNIDFSEYIMIVFWRFYAVAGFILRYIFDYLNITIIHFLIIISCVILLVYSGFFISTYFVDILFSNVTHYHILLVVLIIILAICCGYKPFLFGNVMRFLDRKFSILGIVIINSFCMFCGQLFHICIGFALDNMSISMKVNYIVALSIIPICVLISLILFVYNQDIFCIKSEKESNK